MKTKLILETWRRFLKENTGTKTASEIYNALNDKFRQDFDMVSEDGGFVWDGANQNDIDDYMKEDSIDGFKEFMSESMWDWEPSLFEYGVDNMKERDKVFIALYFMIHGTPRIDQLAYAASDASIFQDIKEACTSIIEEYGMPPEMKEIVKKQADQAAYDHDVDKEYRRY